MDDDDFKQLVSAHYADLYRKARYREHFAFVEARVEIPLEQAQSFECGGARQPHLRKARGRDCEATMAASQCRDGGHGRRY